jgi:hypothetical protein
MLISERAGAGYSCLRPPKNYHCNFDCCLKRLDRIGFVISSHSFVEQRISEPGDHPKKFAGFFRVLLVGQFTRSMFGIECRVDGAQGVKPVANRQAAHQAAASGGC